MSAEDKRYSRNGVDAPCWVCGHLPSDPGHRLDRHCGGATMPEGQIWLCHEDDHSCYSKFIQSWPGGAS